MANDTYLDGLAVGGFSFLVEAGTPVAWEGENWKWKATMVITDTVGFEFGESLTETVFASFFGWNVGIPTKIQRASWTIEGSGICKDCGIPEGVIPNSK